MEFNKKLNRMAFTEDDLNDNLTPNIDCDGDILPNVVTMNYVETPNTPKRGDVYFDIDHSIMKYYDGDSWVPIMTPISVA